MPLLGKPTEDFDHIFEMPWMFLFQNAWSSRGLTGQEAHCQLDSGSTGETYMQK